jgi:hypothetical protein
MPARRDRPVAVARRRPGARRVGAAPRRAGGRPTPPHHDQPRAPWRHAAAAASCAAPGEREGAALRDALASSRASLEALGQPLRPAPAPTAPPDGRPTPQPAAGASSPAALLGAAAARPGRAGAPESASGLLGLGPEALRRALGEPDLRRPEGAAEVWLYTAEACALDLVLYQDRGGGGLRVAHAAARASGAEPRTEAACLREIAAPAAPPGPRAAARPGATTSAARATGVPG